MNLWLEKLKEDIAAFDWDSCEPMAVNVADYRKRFGEDGAMSADEAKELAALLAQAGPEKTVGELDLRNTEIDEQGIEAIAKILPSTDIKILALGEGVYGVDPDSIRHLAAALPDSKITQLLLMDAKIYSDGLEILADALPKTSITTLNLKDNCISDLKPLLTVLPDTQLRTLDLRENNLDDDDAQALNAVLPRTHVTTVLWRQEYPIEFQTQREMERICEENRVRDEADLPETPQPEVTEAARITTIIEKQRRAALEDGQGI